MLKGSSHSLVFTPNNTSSGFAKGTPGFRKLSGHVPVAKESLVQEGPPLYGDPQQDTLQDMPQASLRPPSFHP